MTPDTLKPEGSQILSLSNIDGVKKAHSCDTLHGVVALFKLQFCYWNRCNVARLPRYTVMLSQCEKMHVKSTVPTTHIASQCEHLGLAML